MSHMYAWLVGIYVKKYIKTKDLLLKNNAYMHTYKRK